MKKKKSQQPIIIVGMHRSGTTMITKFLEESGLFVGKAKDDNFESRFFNKLNEMILHQCGASWDNIDPVRYLLEDKILCNIVIRELGKTINSYNIIDYLGYWQYARSRSLVNLDVPWGWKDPRNTATLALWLRLFPDAKIIHVIRHGVDVAASLRTRVVEIIESEKFRHKRHNISFALNPVRSKSSLSPRCHTLKGAFSLWVEYMEEAKRQLSVTTNATIEIAYESFLDEPAKALHTLVGFCDLKLSADKTDKLIKQVKTSRAFAYQSHSELNEFAGSVKPQLIKFGY